MREDISAEQLSKLVLYVRKELNRLYKAPDEKILEAKFQWDVPFIISPAEQHQNNNNK